MAVNGRQYAAGVGTTYGAYRIILDVSENIDESRNVSSINWNAYLIKDSSSGYAYNLDAVSRIYVYIDGVRNDHNTRYDFRSPNNYVGATYGLGASGTTGEFTHGADGKKSVTVRVLFDGPGPLTSGDTGWQTYTLTDFNVYPQAPAPLTLNRDQDGTRIRIRTTSAPYNSGPAIDHYLIYGSINGGVSWPYSWQRGSGNSLDTYIDNLDPTTQYSFHVYAHNGDGYSRGHSGVYSINGVPFKQSLPTISTTDGTSMLISHQGTNLNGLDATAYQYRSSSNNGISWTDSATSSSTSMSFVIPDQFKNYIFQTRAQNSSGWGQWSDSQYGIPSKPASISTTTPVGLKATVTAGTSTGTNITEYYVSASKNNGVTWETEYPMGLDRQYQYVGLSGGKYYIFRVRSQNDKGFTNYTVLPEQVFVPAGGKRWTGSEYIPTAIVKRRTESGWEIVAIAKRWTGDGWEVLT